MVLHALMEPGADYRVTVPLSVRMTLGEPGVARNRGTLNEGMDDHAVLAMLPDPNLAAPMGLTMV